MNQSTNTSEHGLLQYLPTLVLPLWTWRRGRESRELCRAPGQVGRERKGPRSARSHAQTPWACRVSPLLADSDPWPPDASLCPLGGDWGEVPAVTEGGCSPPLPCARLFSGKTGPFHLQSRGCHPFAEHEDPILYKEGLLLFLLSILGRKSSKIDPSF